MNENAYQCIYSKYESDIAHEVMCVWIVCEPHTNKTGDGDLMNTAQPVKFRIFVGRLRE